MIRNAILRINWPSTNTIAVSIVADILLTNNLINIHAPNHQQTQRREKLENKKKTIPD